MVVEPRSRVTYLSFAWSSFAFAKQELTISPSISLTWSTVNFSVSCEYYALASSIAVMRGVHTFWMSIFSILR